jgi:hypothetical protein
MSAACRHATRQPALSHRLLRVLPAGVAAFALATAGLATGCGADPAIEACPPQGTTVNYENFGKAFFETNCNYCHGGSEPVQQPLLGIAFAADTAGGRVSPANLFTQHTTSSQSSKVFTSRARIAEQRDRIYVNSVGDNPPMPPGPNDPSAEERAKLKLWLSCGAP